MHNCTLQSIYHQSQCGRAVRVVRIPHSIPKVESMDLYIYIYDIQKNQHNEVYDLSISKFKVI